VELNETCRISVYPQFPEYLARALDGLRIDSVEQTLTGLPLARLSDESGWLEFVKARGKSLPQYYRAVPILRDTRLSGVIVSFSASFCEVPGLSPPGSSHEEKLLESWGQFASLAVERRGLYEQLSFRAQYDSLTALLNRASLYEHLDARLCKPDPQDRAMALVYLDLDYFKEINDSNGHAAGDKVLQEVARHILESIRHTDFAARIGGDEFVVVLPGVKDRNEARRIAGLLLGAVSQPVLFNGHELSVGASCGVSLFPDDGSQSEALLKSADDDMYRSKMKQRRRSSHRTRSKDTVPSPAFLGV
jgi:diguanylate cyclase (GGDEF)-like protein